MFSLKADETFKWPVKPRVPVDVGKYETVQFTAVFNVLSSEEIASFDSDEENAPISLLRRALVRFEDANFEVDCEGDEARNELLLSKPYMIRPLIDAFNKGLTGYKAKN